MAFSPIYFVGMIFPDLEKYAKKWTGMLYSMCIFMPVYLFLMYVAMSVLNDPNFFAFARVTTNTTNLTGGAAGSLIGPSLIGVVLQYIIAIFLINAPLAAAISVASEGADFMANMMKSVSKWGQGAIVNSQKWAARNGWRETGGRAFNALSKNEGLKNFAGKNIVGEYALKGARSIASDYNETAEKRAKEKDEFRKSLGFDETRMTAAQNRVNDLKAKMAQAKATGQSTADIERRMKIARQRILDIETARPKDYAGRTSVDSDAYGGMGGLYNRLTRSNAIASEQAKIFVHEKEMKRAKEQVEESTKDLKDLQKAINANPTSMQGSQAKGNAAQEAEKTELQNKIASAARTVAEHEKDIARSKLQSNKKI